MRVISGIYKGRRLKSSRDLSIRPTTDRVKEYIFNILLDFPVDKEVIDFFAGSGSLGIEALSRGARKVTFVEKSYRSIQILKENLTHLKIPAEKYQILKQDAFYAVRHVEQSYQLCLMDPPFKYPELQDLLNQLFDSPLLTPDGLLVVEHEVSNPVALESQNYSILSQKKFGRSLITIMEHKHE